ncbi:unnamed protein product [Calypogeia fissa]
MDDCLSVSENHYHSDAHSCTGPTDSVSSCASSTPKSSRLRRTRKKEKSRSSEQTGSKFLQICVEMRDVPVKAVWAFFRDHKTMARTVPGILEGLDYVDGDGEIGSIYVTSYTAKCTRPGELNFVMNRVEVRDDASHLHAVRCLGGRYKQGYKLFLSFLKVLPDEAFGDSSSLAIWRLEYELEHQSVTIPEDSLVAHKISLESFRDRHKRSHQVERPIFDSSEAETVLKPVLKPWRLREKPRQICAPAQSEAGLKPKRTRRKPRRVEYLLKAAETSHEDAESINTHRSNNRRGPSTGDK